MAVWSQLSLVQFEKEKKLKRKSQSQTSGEVHGEVEFRGGATKGRLTSKTAIQRLSISAAPGLCTRQRERSGAMETWALSDTENLHVHHALKHERRRPMRHIRLSNIVSLQKSHEAPFKAGSYMNSKHKQERCLLVNMLSQYFCFFVHSKRDLCCCSGGIEALTIKGPRGPLRCLE